jgi:hypothetical protein
MPTPDLMLPSVQPVEPASTPSDNSDSDSGLEPDLDDSNDVDFVPLPDSPVVSPSPSPSPEHDPAPPSDIQDSRTPPAPALLM